MASKTSMSAYGNIPELDRKGLNYLLFSFRVEVVFADLGVWGNLTGDNKPPAILTAMSAAVAAKTAVPVSTADQQEEIDDWLKALELKARSYFLQKLPYSIALKMRRYTTVADIWQYLRDEYESKGDLQKADLKRDFTLFVCDPKGDVRLHLDELDLKREALETYRCPIDKAVIITSLPPRYSHFISGISAAARVSKSTLKPSDYISKSRRSMTDLPQKKARKQARRACRRMRR